MKKKKLIERYGYKKIKNILDRPNSSPVKKIKD